MNCSVRICIWYLVDLWSQFNVLSIDFVCLCAIACIILNASFFGNLLDIDKLNSFYQNAIVHLIVTAKIVSLVDAGLIRVGLIPVESAYKFHKYY